MSIAAKKSLEALVRFAQHVDEREQKGLTNAAQANVEFLMLAAPYIHDLLVQRQLLDTSDHGLTVREGREVQAHARVIEVLEIITRFGRELGILRKDLAHLRVEVVIVEPITSAAARLHSEHPTAVRVRAEKQVGFISAPGHGHVTKS